jgi:hypothetical protein
MDIKMAKIKYQRHKAHSKERNVTFLITFEEWCYVWEQSGKWELRGRGAGKYVMSRYGDVGPYAIDNVFIQLNEDNARQAQFGKEYSAEYKSNMSKKLKGRVISNEHSLKISKSLLNNKKITCIHCNLSGATSPMKRWHFDNCKRKVA